MSDLFDSFYTKFILRDLFGKIIPGYILLICIIGTCLPEQNFNLLKSMSVGLWLLSIGIAWLLGITIQGIGIITRQFRRFPDILEHNDWKCIIKKFPNLRDKDLKTKGKLNAQEELNGQEELSAKKKRRAKKEKRKAEKRGLRNFQEVIVDFHKVATDDEKKIKERLVVIMEASGNGSIAAGLMFIITLFNGVLSFIGWWELPEFLKSLKSNPGLFPFFLFFLLTIIFSLRFMHSYHVNMKFRHMLAALRSSRLYRSKLKH